MAVKPLATLCIVLNTLISASFEIGVTHTHHDLAPWGNADSVARAKLLLSQRVIRHQNQHIMGFGAMNPEPAPGYYNWSSLDERIAVMVETNATIVITLCCAPDWMKGGKVNQTDWSKIAVAPLPEHYQDFAELAAKVARRYPQIQYFQVWNELKGFWNKGKNRWAYENYTDMYNLVHTAIRTVRSDVEIGGPYVPFGNLLPPGTPSPVAGPWGAVNPNSLAAMRYWLANHVGADFVCLDGHAATNTTTGLPLPDPMTATHVFSALNDWLRTQTSLPIWWSEIYPLPAVAESWPIHQQVDVFTYAMNQVRNASVVLTWPAESDPEEQWTRGTMWNDTLVMDGGYPTPFYTVAKQFNNATNQVFS
eukprot:m.40448 g.40448  ORF g.40448 m.40448 type:complete len:364 (-) comp12742_c0_seq16:1548-2639(-)